KDAATFYLAENDWEQWKIINIGWQRAPVPHPIHVHLIRFQAITRHVYNVDTFDRKAGGTTAAMTLLGAQKQDEVKLKPAERGWKDTFVVNRTELVSIAGEFSGGNGRYMYHCHILEHEDEGMMRTFVVMPEKVMPFDTHPGSGHDHGDDHDH
ncbi:MAG: hypothetical protein QOJ29_212, partial [Thermoleophilaceae bacterium]|nr:hypothetical protein [Thermoleophilaceae bacterium]